MNKVLSVTVVDSNNTHVAYRGRSSRYSSPRMWNIGCYTDKSDRGPPPHRTGPRRNLMGRRKKRQWSIFKRERLKTPQSNKRTHR